MGTIESSSMSQVIAIQEKSLMTNRFLCFAKLTFVCGLAALFVQVAKAEEEMLRFMREQKSEVRDKIIETATLDDELVDQLKAALEEFKLQWQSLVAEEEQKENVES